MPHSFKINGTKLEIETLVMKKEKEKLNIRMKDSLSIPIYAHKS